MRDCDHAWRRGRWCEVWCRGEGEGVAACCLLGRCRWHRHLLLRIVRRLRAHELVKDDGEEEVDDEHATKHRRSDKVDPRPGAVSGHHIEHGCSPYVKSHSLQQRDDRLGDGVEGGRPTLGLEVKVMARLAAVQVTHTRVSIAERACVEGQRRV